jgi:hypothetical protein
MATATPYRWAKSAPPGSTLCPYCEVVYTRGGGSHCPTCGTKLLALQQRLVAVGATPLPPTEPTPLVRPEAPAVRMIPPPDFVRGFARAAGQRWIVPLWVTVLTVLATLTLDRLILPPHRLTSSTDIAPLLALGTGSAAFYLALTALVSLGAGLLLGVVLRRGLYVGALLGGAVVAFAHLSVADLTLATALVVLAHPLLWLVGASLSGRWGRR